LQSPCDNFLGLFEAEICNDNGRGKYTTTLVTGSYDISPLSRARIHNCCLFPHELFFIDIQIQKKASNFKVSISKPDPKGKPVRKEPIGDEIAAGRCIKKSFLKKVNPCEKNFWSIGLQGSIFNPNAENGFVFKDKDCRTFERSDLPIIDPPCPSKGNGKNSPSKGKDSPSKGKGKGKCKKNPSKKRVLYNNNRGKRGGRSVQEFEDH
jgi:hypothetical protein